MHETTTPLSREGRPRSDRAAGLALLEVAVYVGILSVLTAPLTMLILGSTRVHLENDVMLRTSERNRVALFRVAQDVRPAIKANVVISSGTQLDYQTPEDYDGSNVVPGDTIRYSFELATGESSNGKDDNGDGLVDEGRLSRSNLVTGEQLTLCEGLDLGACRFEQNGDAIIVTLSHMGNSRFDYSLTRSITVTPRN